METASGVGESFCSPDSEEKCAQKVTGPGVLVYSHTMQLLHVNRRALELTGGISRTENGPIRVVLSAVIELRAEVQATLDSRIVANVWEPFELKRFVVEPGRELLLRGFGLPDRNADEHSHIVILLEDASLRQADRTEQAPALVQSADMQRAVA